MGPTCGQVIHYEGWKYLCFLHMPCIVSNFCNGSQRFLLFEDLGHGGVCWVNWSTVIDVSEGYSASIFRVEQSKQSTTLLALINPQNEGSML